MYFLGGSDILFGICKYDPECRIHPRQIMRVTALDAHRQVFIDLHYVFRTTTLIFAQHNSIGVHEKGIQRKKQERMTMGLDDARINLGLRMALSVNAISSTNNKRISQDGKCSSRNCSRRQKRFSSESWYHFLKVLDKLSASKISSELRSVTSGKERVGVKDSLLELCADILLIR
ncbi:hypothetical protein BDA99DRAFT_537523 [Phascolomyces articulosus]|uniref:Uncharacterized protein n=1 Tax=Phascolomyces articulosus TaxID=60185 RepID=A0AAD5PDW5_9FUNG|nr:hypothetical protein BDA99DRAFT_537523 [Phascolomyces articulosus]